MPSDLDRARSVLPPELETKEAAAFSAEKAIAGLRVLHVLDHSLPLHSGYAFRTAAILQFEREQGIRPYAVTLSKHEESWKRPAPTVEEIEGFRYYRSGALAPSRIPLRSEARMMGVLARRIRDIAREQPPDLIHAHSPVLCAIPAIREARRLRVPVVYEVRAFWEDAAVDHGTDTRGSLRYRAVRAAETWACRKADRVVVICEGMKQDLVGRGIPAGKIDVSWNGIDPALYQEAEPDREFARSWGLEGKRVLGFLGSFYGYEGLDLLVSALGRLTQRRADLALLLVGGGPMEKSLQEQVRRDGLDGLVVFPGRIAKEQIPSVYALVDILVYPRYSTRLTELVTPLKPLEAMAMGKPLVASDIGGHRELIQQNRTGFLFEPGSVPALAEAIEMVLDDDKLRARLVREGRAWVVEHHAWSKTTAVYKKVYADSLSSREGASAGPVD
jgi:PEP-CTERM/exosortase A-associated glycosyltransferase